MFFQNQFSRKPASFARLGVPNGNSPALGPHPFSLKLYKKHYRTLYDVLDSLKLYSILIQFSGNKSDKSFFANPGPNHKAG